MSVQFGAWNPDGRPMDRDYLEKVEPLLVPYGPDSLSHYSKEDLTIMYFGFHTTGESRHETQPYVATSGNVITWDGRLDNRAQLTHSLADVVTSDSPDVSIVAAAYERWGNDSFAKLIGDWALSIWAPRTHSLILAKDPIGIRHLYYSFANSRIVWSTILDPLVLFSGKQLTLCEEYVAGWFSSLPATHLTPYVGIQAVPPSCYVLLRSGREIVSRYWDFDPGKRIRHRDDADYEEHFRTIFSESVRRRLRSNKPVLAELSGGMDSSSIVCVADDLDAAGLAEGCRLDTLSYYDDSEPNWNELPYIAEVEKRRGRKGSHVDLGSQDLYTFDFDGSYFAPTPNSIGRGTKAAKHLAALMISQGNRVLLSGVGGDEVLGGVPSPIPELADLFARAHFRSLARRLNGWALNKRRPWPHLLFQVVRAFLPPTTASVPRYSHAVQWLNPTFSRRNYAALIGYGLRLKFFGTLPSFQESASTLEVLRRQMASSTPSCDPPYEKRYPYLDRDLLEFLRAIPREQLLRPGQRKSLMRRALVGTVPDELIHRKRKAFVSRRPLTCLQAKWDEFSETTREMISGALGIVDPRRFVDVTRGACQGREAPLALILRTLAVELWLKSLKKQGLLCDGRPSSENNVLVSSALRRSFSRISSAS